MNKKKYLIKNIVIYGHSNLKSRDSIKKKLIDKLSRANIGRRCNRAIYIKIKNLIRKFSINPKKKISMIMQKFYKRFRKLVNEL